MMKDMLLAERESSIGTLNDAKSISFQIFPCIGWESVKTISLLHDEVRSMKAARKPYMQLLSLFVIEFPVFPPVLWLIGSGLLIGSIKPCETVVFKQVLRYGCSFP